MTVVTHSLERMQLISADLFDILTSLLESFKKIFFSLSIIVVNSTSASVLRSKILCFYAERLDFHASSEESS